MALFVLSQISSFNDRDISPDYQLLKKVFLNFFALICVVADALVKQTKEVSIRNFTENDILTFMIIGRLILD